MCDNSNITGLLHVILCEMSLIKSWSQSVSNCTISVLRHFRVCTKWLVNQSVFFGNRIYIFICIFYIFIYMQGETSHQLSVPLSCLKTKTRFGHSLWYLQYTVFTVFLWELTMSAGAVDLYCVILRGVSILSTPFISVRDGYTLQTSLWNNKNNVTFMKVGFTPGLM